MEAAILCETMGWTYEEYLAQPADFIQAIIVMRNERARAERDREKEIEARSRS